MVIPNEVIDTYFDGNASNSFSDVTYGNPNSNFEDYHELPEVVVNSTIKKKVESTCSFWWLIVIIIIYQFNKTNKQ